MDSLPPPPEDLELEEAEPEPKAKKTWTRKLPKIKKKFGKNARLGGNKKNFNPRERNTIVEAAPTQDRVVTAPTAAAVANTVINPKKQSKAELIKISRYAERERRKSKRKADTLQEELKAQKLKHIEDLDNKNKQIKSKSEECNHLAALAQQHRKAANISQQTADVKVAEIAEGNEGIRHECESNVAAAEKEATLKIRKERSFHQSKAVTATNKHAKAVEKLQVQHASATTNLNQSLEKQLNKQQTAHSKELKLRQKEHAKQINLLQKQHCKEADNAIKSQKETIKEKDAKLVSIQVQRDAYKVGEQAALVECQQLKATHTEEIDTLQIDHKAEMKTVKAELRTALAEAVSSGEKRVELMEYEQVELMNTYHGMVEENAEYRRQLKCNNNKMERISITSRSRLIKMRQLKEQQRESADLVVRENRVIE